MQLSVLTDILFVLVVLMLVGYIGAKRGLFEPRITKAMSWLVFNLFLLSSVFDSICDDVPEMSVRELLGILGILTLTIVLGYVISIAAVRPAMKGSSSLPIAEISVSAMNTLLFGLPIVQQVYGSMAVLYMGLSSVPFNIILYSYGALRLSCGEGKSSKLEIKRIFTPIFIVTVLGLIFLFARFPIPNMIQRYLDTTAAATLPMSMIVLGATMGEGDLLGAFKDKRVYFIAFVRLVLCPFVVWLVLSRFAIDPILLRTSVVIAGCPCGVVVPVLALQYEQDALFASRCVMASTLMSVITLPVVILLLG